MDVSNRTLWLRGVEKVLLVVLLAQRLNVPCLMSDALIEEEYGERIAAIFARHGEDYFRELERRVFAQAVERREEDCNSDWWWYCCAV